MPWQWVTDANGWQSRAWTDSATSKTKGRTGQKPQHNRSETEWWTCKHPECIKALKGCGRRAQTNPPKNSWCSFCGLAWNALQIDQQAKVQSVKEELRAKLAEAGNADAAPLSKTQARRQRAKKAAAQANLNPKDHENNDKGSDDQEDVDTSEDEDEVKLPTPEEIKALEATLEAPQPLKADWTPDTVVDGGPQTKAKEQAEDLRGELEDCEAFVEIGDRAAKMGIDLTVTKARIIELKKLIAKAEKKVPAHRVSAAELALGKEKYLERYKENGLRAKKAAGTARQNLC